jgi:hypothetical protein
LCYFRLCREKTHENTCNSDVGEVLDGSFPRKFAEKPTENKSGKVAYVLMVSNWIKNPKQSL